MNAAGGSAVRVSGSFAGLCIASFILACRLVNGPLGEEHAGVSGVERLIGGGRALLSESLYLKADDYFHKGVPHTPKSAFSDVFQKLREQVAPTAHRHAGPGEVEETMPWLNLAVLADDRNVEAANVAAFWLLKSGHAGLAERALLQAASNNPGDYRPMIELARVYLALRAYDRAASVLDMGISKWPRPLAETDRDAIFDLSWLLDFRAALFEREGKGAMALPLIERQAALLPERPELAEHAARIRRGEIDMAQVNSRLEDLFGREPAKCHRETEAEEAEHHEREGEE